MEISKRLSFLQVLKIKILKLNFSKYKKLISLNFVVDENKINTGDILISFVQGQIISKLNIKNLKQLLISIQHHPLYLVVIPIIGLYIIKKNYGITVHKMTTKVDEGKILFVKYFKIKKNDNPQTLRKKSFRLCLNFFKKIF